MKGCMVGLWRRRATSGERNFMEQIKTPIFFETVLAIEIMSELPSNFAEKTTPAS